MTTSTWGGIPEEHRDGVQRFCQMHRLDILTSRQICNRARQLQDTVISTRR